MTATPQPADFRLTDGLVKLLDYYARRQPDFLIRCAAEAPPVLVPPFANDAVGVIRPPVAPDAPVNAASLMTASYTLVNGSAITEPLVVSLDNLQMDQIVHTQVYFRSQYAIYAICDDTAGSLRRELGPQCSISLGSLSSVLFNPELPLYNDGLGRARYSLEQYVDRISGPRLPWVGGNLHEAFAAHLENDLGGLINVDVTNRELAKSLVRTWIRALSQWLAEFRLPSVSDPMCVPYHTDAMPERPQIERMLVDLDVREFRRMVRLVRDTTEAVLDKVATLAIDKFSKAFMRAHPNSAHDWLERSEKICLAHFMTIVKRYLDLRYFEVGVFFDAGNAFARYAACPEPVVVGSFIPTVSTNTRTPLDRQEFKNFELTYPTVHSDKSKHAVTRAPETTDSNCITNDRHERVQTVHYTVLRFLHSESMIAARQLIATPADPLRMAYPVVGAQALLVVLVTRYLFVAHVIPNVAAVNTSRLLQTIDLDAYKFASLVLPEGSNDVRATILRYANAIRVESHTVHFGDMWIGMLDGSLPSRIVGRAPFTAPEVSIPQPPPQPMHVDMPTTPPLVEEPRGSKRTAAVALAEVAAAVVEDATTSSAIEEDEASDDDDDNDEEEEKEVEKIKKAKARKARSHKGDVSQVKTRVRRRQTVLIDCATRKMGEIAELVRLRQIELNVSGTATTISLPGKKISPGANSERSQKRTRLSDANMRWRITNNLQFFTMRAIYRTSHARVNAEPAPGDRPKFPKTGAIRHVLHTRSTPFPDVLPNGMGQLEHLPKLRLNAERESVQPDAKDPLSIDALYQSISENTSMQTAARDRPKGEKPRQSLYSLRQVYVMMLYYNNHCHDSGCEITATPNRHSAVLSELARRFGFTSSGRTARLKVFVVKNTSLFYPISTDYRATPTMNPDLWMANMHRPFLHTSEAPLV
jgi:hypothetical protein